MVGSTLTYSVTLSGTYTGPTDIVGVTNYRVIWAQKGIGTKDVLERGSAMLHRSGGDSLAVLISSTYSNLSTPLPGNEAGSITPAVLTWSGTVLHENWSGSVSRTIETVPAMPIAVVPIVGLVLMGLGVLALSPRKSSSRS